MQKGSQNTKSNGNTRSWRQGSGQLLPRQLMQVKCTNRKKESAWFWPLNWKSEWQTLTLWLYSLIKVSLFWPYYGSLKGFQSNPCRLAATKSTDAFDVQGTVCILIIWTCNYTHRQVVGKTKLYSGQIENIDSMMDSIHFKKLFWKTHVCKNLCIADFL